jgi:hypothetical protein
VRYAYKVVSLEKFISENRNLRINPSASAEMSQAISEIVEALLNCYADDGWEYWRSEEFESDTFKSAAGLFFDGLSKALTKGLQTSGLHQVFIFRRALTDQEAAQKDAEAQSRIQFEREKAVSERGIKAEVAATADAKCPNCDSLLKRTDTECWRCKASFGEGSTWRPIPL